MDRHESALQVLRSGTVIPATPLALDDNRKFDESVQRLLMRYYLNSGVGGIATAVHSTQFEIRDPKYGLFEPVLRLVSEETDAYEKKSGKTIVRISGVCGPLRQAVSEAETARKYEYDAVLLSPGGLNGISEQGLLERTKAVAKVLPVIGFYLQPAVGGRTFSYRYWQHFCEIPNTVAIKCASFNRYTTLDVVRAATFSSRAKEITLYTGNDDNLLVDLLTEYHFPKDGRIWSNRLKGGLLGQWCIWTAKVVKLFRQIEALRTLPEVPAKWLTLAAQITDANAAVFDAAHQFRGCIPGLHEVLRRQGLFRNNFCLDPRLLLSPGQGEEIDRVCAMYPNLSDDAFIRLHMDEWKAD